MSRHPDPCYCAQAQEYEQQLERIIDATKSLNLRQTSFLIMEARELIDSYKKAQEEYASE